MAVSDGRRAWSAQAGFTLFEVLAAVAMLGLVYIVLADAAMQGMRAEGVAGRLLRASLIADTVLSDLEVGFATGAPAPIGHDQREEEEFLAEWDVDPYDLATAVLAQAPESRNEGRRGPREAVLLAAPRNGEAPLLRIAVRVSWQEGAHERDVLRTSFAFDRVAAAPVLEALATAADAANEAANRDAERPR